MCMERHQWAWPAAGPGNVRVKLGVIEAQPGGKLVHPFELPDLPNSLARVQAVDDAVRFVETYGLLGRHALLPEDQRLGGDPLDWVLEQASTVRFVMRLLWALQGPDERELRAILDGRRVALGAGNQEVTLVATNPSRFLTLSWDIERADPLQNASVDARDVREGANWGGYVVALGPRRQVLFHVTSPAAEGDSRSVVLRHAQDLVTLLVNGNTKGVRPTLACQQGRFEWRLTARALVEAIWYHVGTMAVRARSGEGRWVRLCEECGTPFLVTDRRQRFCPPDYGSTQSRCGARARWRRRHGKAGHDPNGMRET